MHLLILSQLAQQNGTGRPRIRGAVLRAFLCVYSVMWSVTTVIGCSRPEPSNGKSSESECFRITPSGPMLSRDSVQISKLFRLVRMDSTHIRWNSEVDSATMELRYLYLHPKVESLGYGANFWAKDARSDSVHLWGGNGFSGVHLVLAPHGHSLIGSATVGGDAPGGHSRYVGLVRADPVACGSLLHLRPADAGWSTDDDTAHTVHHVR